MPFRPRMNKSAVKPDLSSEPLLNAVPMVTTSCAEAAAMCIGISLSAEPQGRFVYLSSSVLQRCLYYRGFSICDED